MLYPEFPDTFWSFKHALKFVRKKAAFPPLGLLTVASMLPNDWEKRLVDLNVSVLREADLEWADMVLISGMIAQSGSAKVLIERCVAAGKTVLAGGPLFTSAHADFEDVDHFILNEAEVTLPEFLRDLEAGRPKKIYKTSLFPDLSTTPVPQWELADMRRYGSMCLQYSRGCPFDCEFCDVTAKFGQRSRTKSASQVIAELDALFAAGWRGPVFFVDDNFIGNKRRLREELLPPLTEWQKARHRPFTFYTEASINLADDEVLTRQIVDAGFDAVFIGIETPDEAGLLECNKRQNQGRNLLDDVKRLQRAGSAGGLHRRIRLRHAFDFQAADRVHPEKRHYHSDGRDAQRAAGHKVVRAFGARGPPHRFFQRRQCGWNDQLPAEDGLAPPARWIP